MLINSHGFSFPAKGWTRSITVEPDDVPQDLALPDLPEFLKTNTIANALSRKIKDRLPKDYRLTEAKIVFLRYKPSRYCNIFVELNFANKSGSTSCRQLVAGKIISAKLADQAPNNAAQIHLATPNCGAMQYTLFPVDPKIPSLDRLANKHALENKVRGLLDDAQLGILPTGEDGCLGQVLSYRPERYFLLKLDTGSEGTERKNRSRKSSLALRLFHSQKAAATSWHTMQMLWRHSKQQSMAPLIPQPLGWCDTDQLCAYAIAPGNKLSSHLQDDDLDERLDIAAQALAGIHACPLSPNAVKHLTVVNSQSLLGSISAMATALRDVKFIDHAKLTAVLDLLHQKVPQEVNERRFLHGDFSTNQILIDGKNATTIDFSGVYGEVYIDLGCFLSRLKNTITGSRYDHARFFFIQRYQSYTSVEVDIEQLKWFESTHIIKDAFIPIKKLRANWQHQFDQRMDLAYAHLRDLND